MSRFLLVAVFAFGASRDAFASDDSDMEDVVSQHRATIEAIASLHVKIRVSYDPAPAFGIETIDYWRDGDEFKRKFQTTNGQRSESYQKGTTFRSFDRVVSPTGEMVDSGQIVTGIAPMYGDPNLLCLFAMPAANQFRAPLATVLKEPHQRAKFKRVTESGREYAVIALTHEKAKLEVWLSKQHNYLISKLIIWMPADAKYPLGQDVVDEFREVSPGVYFPTKVTGTGYSPTDGKVAVVRTVAVDEVQINKPVPRVQLAFQFPPNLTVIDAIQNKVWKTGARGEIGVEAKTADGQTMTIGQPGPPPDGAAPEGVTVATATLEEPKSVTRWILPISLGLIGLGLALYLIHRFRARQTS